MGNESRMYAESSRDSLLSFASSAHSAVQKLSFQSVGLLTGRLGNLPHAVMSAVFIGFRFLKKISAEFLLERPPCGAVFIEISVSIGTRRFLLPCNFETRIASSELGSQAFCRGEGQGRNAEFPSVPVNGGGEKRGE